MFDKIKKLFSKIPNPLQKEEETGLKCPNCGAMQWLEGPSGGGSVNVMCNQCKSKYNYMGPFGLQELEIRNDHKNTVQIIRDEKLRKLLE